MKKMHKGQKGLTLIELLIVVAILGIIAAVVIPNLGAFMVTGRISAANSEAENVKTASLAYYAEHSAWPDHTNSANFTQYLAGDLLAEYNFDTMGFIRGVGDPGADPAAGGTTSSGYQDIVWVNPSGDGHGKWERGS